MAGSKPRLLAWLLATALLLLFSSVVASGEAATQNFGVLYFGTSCSSNDYFVFGPADTCFAYANTGYKFSTSGNSLTTYTAADCS